MNPFRFIKDLVDVLKDLIKFKERKDNIVYVVKEVWGTWVIFRDKYFWPVMWVITPIWTWLSTKYVGWYKKLAFKDGMHCRKRGARALAILSVVTVASLYSNVFYVVPYGARLVYDMVAFEVFSYKVENVYFGTPEWIEEEGGQGDKVLAVTSCEAKPCNEDNSNIYRFRDSLYLDLKYYITRFEPYDHEEIAGIMQEELNYCTVYAYSKRQKILGWYPYIYKIEGCYAIPEKDNKGEKK